MAMVQRLRARFRVPCGPAAAAAQKKTDWRATKRVAA